MIKFKLFLMAFTSAVLLAACQTTESIATKQHTRTVQCNPARIPQDRAVICFDPNWADDAMIDSSGGTNKIMVVLNEEGIEALRKAQSVSPLIALQLADQTFTSFSKKAITSGFLVLKPFKNREDAQRVLDLFIH